MKLITLAGVAAAALLSVPALAQQGDFGARFGQPMTRASMQARVQAQFARLDANRDGFITQGEIQSAPQGMRSQRRGMRAGRTGADRFARFDTNRDGVISRAEFDARTADRAERRATREERRAAPGTRPNRGGAMARFGARMFERADTNRDGRISFAEMSARALARFDRMDANRDGTVTVQERQALRAQRQDRRGS